MSGQMDDGMGLCFAYHAVAGSGIANIFDQQRWFSCGPNPAIFADAKVVHYDDVFAALQQAVYDRRPDESATARDQIFPHQDRSLFTKWNDVYYSILGTTSRELGSSL
jgi:hypothetical protein